MTGCATGASGAPMGGRMLLESYRYRPATPAAMPRAIPEALEESTPTVVQAPARPGLAPGGEARGAREQGPVPREAPPPKKRAASPCPALACPGMLARR